MDKYFENFKKPFTQEDVRRLKEVLKSQKPIAVFQLPKVAK